MSNADYDAGWQAGHATGKLIAQQHPPTVINYYYGMPPQQAPRRRSLARWLWTLAIVCVLATLLLTQRQRLAPLVTQLAARFGSAPIATVNGKPVSELVPTVKAAVQSLATPQPTDAPAPTEVPTLGTNATVPEAPTGTPERAQEEPQAVIADAQPSATPIPTAAPYVPPTAPPFVPTPAPEPQAVPTATQEPMGQPVQAQPEAVPQLSFGQLMQQEADKLRTAQPVSDNPSMPQDAPPAANVIR